MVASGLIKVFEVYNKSPHEYYFLPFTFYLTCAGVKHWIFSMKHWKLSLVLEQCLTGQCINPWVNKLESIIYYSAIALCFIVCLSMIPFYNLHNKYIV